MVRQRLQRLMEERGVKVAQLAYRAEVSDAAVYNILNGADPKLSTLARIARALGVRVSDLIDETELDVYLEGLRTKTEAFSTKAA